jgi:hypothetical protein
VPRLVCYAHHWLPQQQEGFSILVALLSLILPDPLYEQGWLQALLGFQPEGAGGSSDAQPDLRRYRKISESVI